MKALKMDAGARRIYRKSSVLKLQSDCTFVAFFSSRLGLEYGVRNGCGGALQVGSVLSD